MSDPLSLLRQYFVNKRQIVEKNGMICFGEYCWPKNVKTNYLIYSSSRDGPNKSYYTLDCLMYFLNNLQLQHPTYVKQAAALNILVVQRPDRKDLLSYLTGDSNFSASIDKSAPIEIPKSATQLLKESQHVPGTLERDEDGQAPSKLARFDAPKLKKLDLLIPGDGLHTDGDVVSLSDALSNDQIAALKAKRLAKKRSTISDNFGGDGDGVPDIGIPVPNHSVSRAYDSNFTKEIQNKERTWRNRTNILQSTGKDFQRSIFAMLITVKVREEGVASARKSIVTPVALGLNAAGAPQQYNRYDQERFMSNDAPSGFRIDTTSSYHGLTLKSVTAEAATPKAPLSSSSVVNDTNGTSAIDQPTPQKRVSRTPIIIIPATNSSLITMYNAKAIMQDLKFIDSKSSDQRRENEVLIQRRKADNTTVPYLIIDNPLKLTPDEWNRVVAVFVQGPAWQFKGWPWQGNPVEIFSRIKAFHIKFEENKLDTNVSKWSVEIIELSRSKRHLDRANLLKFWSLLDKHILKCKPNARR